MTLLKLATRKAAFAYILILVQTGSLFFSPPVQTQSTRRSGLIEKVKRFFFGTRPGGTPTGRKRGGAVRDRCPNIATPLTALVPSTAEGFSFVEQTIAERPTFWFYVPYFPASDRSAEFVLIDEKENDVYAATFPLTQPPGIVNLQLPGTMPPLKEGKQYRWVFSIICNPANRSGDATVNGWIERVPISSALSGQLEVATVRERVSIYADARLWDETLTSLAELQRTNPQDRELKAEWTDVLRAIGLTEAVPETWSTYSLPAQHKNSRKTK
ncbi:MAG: DUF928 domain-containing protein [Coleofasciculus sp. Co-bin14]|nr:DUF928 domain-containing protein [Coleofasciculus sp. Co-bin14]